MFVVVVIFVVRLSVLHLCFLLKNLRTKDSSRPNPFERGRKYLFVIPFTCIHLCCFDFLLLYCSCDCDTNSFLLFFFFKDLRKKIPSLTKPCPKEVEIIGSGLCDIVVVQCCL